MLSWAGSRFCSEQSWYARSPGSGTESIMVLKRVQIDRAFAAHTPSPIFVGDVHTQNLVAEDDADLLRVSAVTFEDGAHNRWHRHTTDQVLVVTEGRGIVATETEEMRVGPGEVVFIPAGERHWHGAEPGCTVTHISIVTPGHMTVED
ncbi:MAG: cupin domain-containing protein [Thermomicrobiales bacterium]|nr:cupin domain-containing protein [Thermomicrobiales bacterium]